jgi:hypothetical protein
VIADDATVKISGSAYKAIHDHINRTTENIKAAVAAGLPVYTEICGKPSIVVGYNDFQRVFIVRECNGQEKKVPYNDL